MSNKNRKYVREFTHRAELLLPEDMEKEVRANASGIGLNYGRKGNVSGYIRLLIINDIKTMEPLNLSNTKQFKGETTRIHYTIDKDLYEKAQDRALELGFIRGGKGNVSGYIKYLISLDVAKDNSK